MTANTKFTLKEKIRQHVIDCIKTGQDNAIPSERILANELNACRSTIRNAMASLVQEGIIRPVYGSGYVAMPDNEKNNGKTMAGLIVRRNYELFERDLFDELGKYLNQLNIGLVYHSLDPEEKLFPTRLSHFMSELDIMVFSGGIIESKAIYEVLGEKMEQCVILGTNCNPAFPVKNVRIDLNDGCYKLARHLINQGHKKIAFAGLLKDKGRISGIRRACAKSGLELDEGLLFETHGSKRYDGFKVAKKMFSDKRKFTTVICHNDLVALGFMEYCLMHGIKIPDDVSITGFDDLEDSRHYPIPLTTVKPDRAEMVKKAVEMTRKKLDPDNPGETVKVKLKIRESTR